MKKLGGVESVEEFVLAIAGGADVNGTWKGSPLVEYLFGELMRYWGRGRKYENLVAKYQALIAAGADVEHLIYGDPTVDYFGDLVRRLTIDLQLLSILLTSPQARALIQESSLRRGAMAEAFNSLRALLAQIEEAGMDEEAR